MAQPSLFHIEQSRMSDFASITTKCNSCHASRVSASRRSPHPHLLHHYTLRLEGAIKELRGMCATLVAAYTSLPLPLSSHGGACARSFVAAYTSPLTPSGERHVRDLSGCCIYFSSCSSVGQLRGMCATFGCCIHSSFPLILFSHPTAMCAI